MSIFKTTPIHILLILYRCPDYCYVGWRLVHLNKCMWGRTEKWVQSEMSVLYPQRMLTAKNCKEFYWKTRVCCRQIEKETGTDVSRLAITSSAIMSKPFYQKPNDVLDVTFMPLRRFLSWISYPIQWTKTSNLNCSSEIGVIFLLFFNPMISCDLSWESHYKSRCVLFRATFLCGRVAFQVAGVQLETNNSHMESVLHQPNALIWVYMESRQLNSLLLFFASSNLYNYMKFIVPPLQLD